MERKLNKWQKQLAVGRVFELKARHGSREPICVMIVRDPFGYRGGYSMCEQVDGNGLRKHWNGRFYAGSMQLHDFTSSKIARRRRDLERLDARDIALVNYGIAIDFAGRWQMESYSYNSIPFLMDFPETEFTIFWTSHSVWLWDYHRTEAARKVAELLRGDWHFIVEKQKNSYAPISLGNNYMTWATTKTDKATLARLEAILRAEFPDLQRTTYSMRGYDDGDRITYRAVGSVGPGISATSWAYKIKESERYGFGGAGIGVHCQ